MFDFVWFCQSWLFACLLVCLFDCLLVCLLVCLVGCVCVCLLFFSDCLFVNVELFGCLFFVGAWAAVLVLFFRFAYLYCCCCYFWLLYHFNIIICFYILYFIYVCLPLLCLPVDLFVHLLVCMCA